MLTTNRSVAFARRINPQRKDLLVSLRLGKHVPTLGAAAVEDGRSLAECVKPHVKGRVHVIGLAETATALGFFVASELQAISYVTTSRNSMGAQCRFIRFSEEHSHAPSHSVCANWCIGISNDDTIVIVDDEVSTGKTLRNLIYELTQVLPGRPTVLVASLVDARPGSGDGAPGLLELEGVTVISLQRVNVDVQEYPSGVRKPASCLEPPRGGVSMLPTITCTDQRHYLSPSDMNAVQLLAHKLAEEFAFLPRHQVLILGSEDFMTMPILVAQHLGVHVQSTTRSPIYVSEEERYPIRSGWTFPALSDPQVPAFLYNANHGHPQWSDAILFTPASSTAQTVPEAAVGCVNTLQRLFDHVWLQPVLEEARLECRP